MKDIYAVVATVVMSVAELVDESAFVEGFLTVAWMDTASVDERVAAMALSLVAWMDIEQAES